MDDLIAALPMYDLPERRAETDAEWAELRQALLRAGIAAPERLVRRNADMPAVPGGIRDAAGAVIAPDPASLPPGDLDLATLWRHPGLLFAQTCWGPMGQGLEAHVSVVGQPDYSAHEGGAGALYSSAVLMRRDLPSPLRGGSDGQAGRGGGGEGDACSSPSPPRLPSQATASDPPRNGEGGVPSPAGGHALLPVAEMRGRRLAYNGPDSMSGILALGCDLEAMGEGLDVFAERIETGAHRASVVAVAQGRADVCAVDCRTWTYLRRFEPRAREVSVVGWTARRKGLPYIMSRHLTEGVAEAVRAVLARRPSVLLLA